MTDWKHGAYHAKHRKRAAWNVKRMRTERRMTQDALAAQVHIHRVYLAQMEGATRGPSLARLDRLARALTGPVGTVVE